MKKIIGTNRMRYPEIRNFVGLPFQKYKFEKRQDFCKAPVLLYNMLSHGNQQYYWNSYRDFDLNQVELFHFFNTLSYGSKPWITTFETYIPRWGGRDIKSGLKLIANSSCKKIIALSNCTANIQRKIVSENFPEFIDIIEEKLLVLHPPQKCPPIKSIKKTISDKIIFSIVGSDFFRKGGKEILLAFDRLFETGIKNWELNIVSNMQYGDYASKSTIEDLKLVYKIIRKYPNNINHEKFLPNKEVLKLFNQTHIGLLPTYADTYGYSVLEAQAYGCPVITTNVRALPEINNSDLGWLINVKLDEIGNAVLNTDKHIKNFSNNLTDELENLFSLILKTNCGIINKGIKSHKKLQNSIDNNTKFLENIYNDITVNGV